MGTCRVCGKPTEYVQTVPNYPMCAGPVADRDAPPVGTMDISVGYCADCRMCSLETVEMTRIEYGATYTSSNIAGDGKLEAFLDFCGPIAPTAEVLEIGCYDGSFMLALQTRYGCKVYGCDPCEWAVKKARAEGLRVQLHDFREGLYPEKSFDTVILRNVLEHVGQPEQLLDTIKPVLAGGRESIVAVTVPDGEKRIWRGILGSIVPEHPLYFGEESLQHLLWRSGIGSIQRRVSPGLIMAKGIFAWDVSVGQPQPLKLPLALLAKGAQLSKNRADGVREALKNTENVYLFGANTCAVELLARKAVDLLQVVAAIDDDPYRWGKVIVNTEIPVAPREAVGKAGKGSTFVVCSYYSQDALVEYIVKHAKPPFKVVKLYPSVEVIEK